MPDKGALSAVIKKNGADHYTYRNWYTRPLTSERPCQGHERPYLFISRSLKLIVFSYRALSKNTIIVFCILSKDTNVYQVSKCFSNRIREALTIKQPEDNLRVVLKMRNFTACIKLIPYC